MVAFEKRFLDITGEKIDYNRATNDFHYLSKYKEAIRDATIFANNQTEILAPSGTQFGRSVSRLFQREGKTTDMGTVFTTLMSYNMNESREFLSGLRDVSKSLSGKRSADQFWDGMTKMVGLMTSNTVYWYGTKLLKAAVDYGAGQE